MYGIRGGYSYIRPSVSEHLRLPSHSVFNEETCTLNFINLVVRIIEGSGLMHNSMVQGSVGEVQKLRVYTVQQPIN